MTRKKKCLLIVLAILVVIMGGAAFGVLGYWQPWQEAKSSISCEGKLILTAQEEGMLDLTWPEGFGQDRYHIQIIKDGQVLLENWVTEAKCTLPPVEPGSPVELCITTACGYRFPFEKEERIRMGENTRRITLDFQMPAIGTPVCTPNPEDQTVHLAFDLEEDTFCQVYLVQKTSEDSQNQQVLLDTLDQGEITIPFGKEEKAQVPRRGDSCRFLFDAYRVTPELVYYGRVTQEITVTREDLLGRNLALACKELGNNVYELTWRETKGAYYRVEMFDPAAESWATLQKVEGDAELRYTTGHLPRYSENTFRVVAVGGDTLPDSEFAAVSQEITVTTGTTAVYATVWPIQQLDVYGDPEKTDIFGKVQPAQALCVLDEVNGLFQVRIGDREGYIDSNYCLINLPEYLEDLCLYDIANSYASLYMAHEYELPTVTGQVIVGYEKVQMRDKTQLVPILYPVAKRLEKAAFAAIAQGYQLKIYDAYRPREATIALYDQAIGLKDQPIPLETYTGKVLEDLPVLEEGQILTYGNLMTDFDRYAMNYFLAAGKSRHNRGIALDLTLADLDTGRDLPMQTSMHDLSWYSENARDNGNARKLSAIMESVGFTGLRSEWWHFNDLEVQDTFQPEYMMKGVTPECWMKDDRGWRYRKSNGDYYTDCVKKINDTEYTFDENGYVIP